MYIQIDKISDCEYEIADPTSGPCHNTATHIDRDSSLVLCVNHVEPFRVLLEEEDRKFATIFAKDEEAIDIPLEEKVHDPNEGTIAILVPGAEAAFVPIGPTDENRGD